VPPRVRVIIIREIATPFLSESVVDITGPSPIALTSMGFFASNVCIKACLVCGIAEPPILF
jgi:hypothetical protein